MNFSLGAMASCCEILRPLVLGASHEASGSTLVPETRVADSAQVAGNLITYWLLYALPVRGGLFFLVPSEIGADIPISPRGP